MDSGARLSQASLPASDEFAPQSAQESAKQRVNHSYIWLGGTRVAALVVLVILSSLLPSLAPLMLESGWDFAFTATISLLVGIGIFIVIVSMTVLIRWLCWRNLSYQLTADEFNLYTGVLNKKRIHIPYQRIQSINQHASFLQRIFGVCVVVIDTAGGYSNKAVKIPYVSKSKADVLRRELFVRKGYFQNAHTNAEDWAIGQIPEAQNTANVLDAFVEPWRDFNGLLGGDTVNTGKTTYEYGLSNKELFLTGLSHNSEMFWTIFILVSSFLSVPLANWIESSDSSMFLSTHLVAVSVVMFVMALVIMWIVSIVSICISFGGFKACRCGSRIEVEQGLLHHKIQGVDINRVQTVVVKQGVIKRLMGYCELAVGKIDAESDNNGKQHTSTKTGSLVIHPFVKVNRVDEILEGLIPEFSGKPTKKDAISVAPVALHRALVRSCVVYNFGFYLIIVAACLHIGLHGVADLLTAFEISCMTKALVVSYVFGALIIVVSAAKAILWFRTSGFSYNNRFMQINNDGFSCETVVVPRQKIQFGYTKTNPLQRRVGTATINVGTAVGVGSGTRVLLIDVRENDAQKWLTWLKPKGGVEYD